MKRTLLLFVCMLFFYSCELTVKQDITSQYLVDGIANKNLDVYLQETQVFRYRGKPGAVTIPIGSQDLSKYKSCFVLHVATGTAQATIVSSAIIKIDGQEILNSSDFSKNGGEYTFEVCDLTPTSAISVEVRGEPGSYIDIWIEGRLKLVMPTEGLIAYYPLDGNTNDMSGNSKDGTPQNLSYTYNRFNVANSSGYFDGSSSAVLLPGTWGGSELTISAWINVESLTNDFYAIVESDDWGYFVHLQVSENPLGGIGIEARPTLFDLNPVLSCQPLHTWRHVVLIVKSGDTKLYENGLIVRFSDQSLSYLQPSSNVRIGQGYHGVRFFHGAIDDVRIYNRALTDSEVQLLYHEGE